MRYIALMKKHLKILLPLVLLTAFGSTSAAAPAEKARAQLDAFADDIHSLSCRFVQTVTDARGDAQPEVRGTLALQEPRQFRWQTTQPENQLIVADGARVWIYDPGLEQVTVRKQSQAEAHSPLTVLTDLSQLDRDFTVTEAGQRDGLQWLRLTPRGEDTQFNYAELGLSDKQLRRMLFHDTLGGQSEIRFQSWQRNPKLDSSLFQFQPPPGVDVVGDDMSMPQIQGVEP